MNTTHYHVRRSDGLSMLVTNSELYAQACARRLTMYGEPAYTYGVVTHVSSTCGGGNTPPVEDKKARILRELVPASGLDALDVRLAILTAQSMLGDSDA